MVRAAGTGELQVRAIRALDALRRRVHAHIDAKHAAAVAAAEIEAQVTQLWLDARYTYYRRSCAQRIRRQREKT